MADSIFEARYTLRAADFGIWSRLRPSAILDLFQDAAGRHSIARGCGSTQLAQRELAWVLMKVRFRVHKSAAMYQPVRVRTWPLEPGRASFRREYLILDEVGETIVSGSGEWVLINTSTRRIAPAGDVYGLPELCTERNFADGFPRLGRFEPEGESHICRPTFSDYDMNGHVNNTKYANFVLDALELPREEVIRDFRLDYHREILPHTDVNIVSRREDKAIQLRGENDSGEAMFSCRIDLE